jgi:hypothetical protein
VANVSPPANRRRARLIDRQFQLGLAWRMMLVFSVFFVAGIAAVFAPSMFILATGSGLETLEPAAREFLILHRRIWPAALLVFGGVFAYTLVYSHRIAGPIHRINNILREMLEEKYPAAVVLRKGDHFGETAGLLEKLAKKLSADGKSRGTEGGGGAAR